MAFLIVAGVFLLAYSNGANDNAKGVATLLGSGVADYRRALRWATGTTLAGSLLALVLARGLVAAFSGKGLVPDALTTSPAFLLAVSGGAGLTVLAASRLGLPVSTTHSLLGGLLGAGLVATRGHVNLAALGSTFLLPMLASPLVAIALTLVLYPLARRARTRLGITSESCLCVGQPLLLARTAGGREVGVRGLPEVHVDTTHRCIHRYGGAMFGVDAETVVQGMHYLSSGLVGFARGLNDAPKIVALLLGAGALAPDAGLALVAGAMAAGGALQARRVAETLSRRITTLNPGQGLVANLVTSSLVTLASRFGLPVSTTHVSVGSLFGIAAVTRSARWQVVGTILAAWATTLPVGAATAALLYVLLT